MKKYFLIFFLITVLIPSTGISAPTSAALDGTTLTILGTFTANASPGPIDDLSENIEAGTPDAEFSKSGWSAPNAWVYTTSDSHSGTKSLYGDLQGLSFLDRAAASELDMTSGNYTTIYMSVWLKTILTMPATCTRFQYKAYRFDNEPGYNMDTGFFINAWWFGPTIRFAGNGDLLVWEDAANSGNYWSIGNDPFVDSVWERYEVTLYHSDPGVANGSMKMIRVGTGTVVGTQQGGPQTAHETRSIPTDYYNYFRLQAEFFSLRVDNGDPCSDEDITAARFQVYQDDVYISDTEERVEVSNSSTWAGANPGIREVLVTTAKTTGVITATYSTTLTGDVYAYEVLPDGSANANGVLISSTAPVLTCQSNDTTTETSYAITATYTLEGARTVSTCTWSNSLGGSGSLTATGGNISGTITGLSTGDNVITITLTDSEAEEGVCNVTITKPAETAGSPATLGTGSVMNITADGSVMNILE